MKRWRAYDDELVGLEEYCKEEVRLDEEWQQEQGQAADREETPEAKLSRYMFSERQMAVAYKTLYDACENGVLMSLAVHPFWVFSTPHLVSEAGSVTCDDLIASPSLFAGAILDPSGRVS